MSTAPLDLTSQVQKKSVLPDVIAQALASPSQGQGDRVGDLLKASIGAEDVKPEFNPGTPNPEPEVPTEDNPLGGFDAIQKLIASPKGGGLESSTPQPSLVPQPPAPKPQTSFGQKLAKVLPILGMAGGALEAAGNGPFHPPVGAEMYQNALAQAGQRALKKQELEQVEVPKAQAYVDYTSGRNQTSLEREGIRQQGAANVAQIRNQAGMVKNQVQALQAGLVPVFNGNGQQTGFRAATKDEIAQAPMLQAHLDRLNAQTDYETARAQLDLAHHDVLMNPDNPTFQQRERQIQAQAALAGKRLQISEQHLSIAAANLQRQNAQFQIDNGVTPTGAPAQITAPGQIVDNEGNVIGKKFQGNVAPTTAARNRADQAQAIEIVGRGLVDQIKANSDQLGPILGRYNSLKDFIGDPSPQYKGLKSALESWIALHPAAHGFRGLNAVNKFEEAFGRPINTPESLIAGIEGSYGTMEGLQTVGSPRVVGGGGNRANPNLSAGRPINQGNPPPKAPQNSTPQPSKKKDSLGIL